MHFLRTIFCNEKKALAFDRDRWCHVVLCLLLILFHCLYHWEPNLIELHRKVFHPDKLWYKLELLDKSFKKCVSTFVCQTLNETAKSFIALSTVFIVINLFTIVISVTHFKMPHFLRGSKLRWCVFQTGQLIFPVYLTYQYNELL